MSTTTKSPKFHVVCRECSVERLFETDTAAAEFERRHADTHDHQVETGRVC
jgi:hypothetical protein